MTAVFFYGTLCHPALLEAVLGRRALVQPARLPDHAIRLVAGRSYPMMLAAVAVPKADIYSPAANTAISPRVDCQ